MNLTLDQTYVCNATTDGDPDIAGAGVISSFIVNAWITVLVALVPGYYALAEWWYHINVGGGKWQRILHFSSTRAISERFPGIAFEASNNLLGSLCDFQVLTGTAIVISAMAQLPKLSFYHEQVAISLWWATLNSFWAARIGQVYGDTEWFSKRMTLRRIGIFISVISGLTFQVIINIREDRYWQINEEGRCYLFEDGSSSWPWVVGTCLYGFTLLLDIAPFGRSMVKAYLRKVDRGQKAINAWCLNAFDGTDHRVSMSTERPANTRPSSESRPLQKGLSTVSVIIFFLLRQFLAIWSYGDGFYPLHVIAYMGFAIWNTVDVLTLKIWNQPLIVGGENKWGFGQVFPVIMIAATGFAAFDALIAAKAKVDRKKPTRHATL